MSARAKRDTLPSDVLHLRGRPLTYNDEGPAGTDDGGSWTAAIFIGLTLVAAVLFTLYLLLWDGGGNT